MTPLEFTSRTADEIVRIAPGTALFTRRSHDSNVTRRVVLLHNAGGSSASWDSRLTQLLVERGCEVLLLDLRDSGKSSRWPHGAERYSVDDLGLDVATALRHFRWTDAVVLGVGLGAAVATAAARATSGLISAVIAVSPVQADPSDRAQRVLMPQLQSLSTRDAFGGHQPVPVEAFSRRRVAHLAALAGSDFDPRAALRIAQAEYLHADDIITQLSTLPRLQVPHEDAAAIDVPVLVVHGAEDPVLPLPLVSEWASSLSSARLLMLAGAGHADLPPSSWPILVDMLQFS